MTTDNAHPTEGRMLPYIGQPPANANIQPLEDALSDAIKEAQASGRIAAPDENLMPAIRAGMEAAR